MTIERLIEVLREFPGDLEVQVEIGDVKAQVSDVYEDPAYGVVFVSGEPDE